MPEGTGFASSTVTMMDCVRGMMEGSGASLADALRMASASPARVLGISDRKGSVADGLDADLVAFDADQRVHLTVAQGEIVHRAEALLAAV
jgi:N-acetylglucosamine-6-phosphate deacetylase